MLQNFSIIEIGMFRMKKKDRKLNKTEPTAGILGLSLSNNHFLEL